MKIVYTAYEHYPTQLAQLFSNKKYYDALKNTLDFFVSIELADGNMPTNVNGTCASDYGDDPDARVQWLSVSVSVPTFYGFQFRNESN